MQIKPRGIFFLIPIGLLVVSGIIAIVLFYQAIIVPLHNINVANINEPIEMELFEGDFIALFIDDSEIDRFEFTDYGNYYNIQYFVGTQSYIITITVESGESDEESFIVQEMDSVSSYRVNEYYNFADIEIQKDGTYTFAFSSYDDINIGFGYIATNILESGIKILIALLVGVLGFIGTIVSFIIIIVKRANSRKLLLNNSEPSQFDLLDMNKKPEKKEKPEKTIDKFDF